MSYDLMSGNNQQFRLRETHEQFRALRNKAVRRRLWDKLTGQEHTLLDLNEVQKGVKVQNRAHSGIRLVPLEKIRAAPTGRMILTLISGLCKSTPKSAGSTLPWPRAVTRGCRRLI
jgi:hypothetical protein